MKERMERKLEGKDGEKTWGKGWRENLRERMEKKLEGKDGDKTWGKGWR